MNSKVDMKLSVNPWLWINKKWRLKQLGIMMEDEELSTSDSTGKANTTIRMDGAVGGWLIWADCYPGYVRLIQIMSGDLTLDPKGFLFVKQSMFLGHTCFQRAECCQNYRLLYMNDCIWADDQFRERAANFFTLPVLKCWTCRFVWKTRWSNTKVTKTRTCLLWWMTQPRTGQTTRWF